MGTCISIFGIPVLEDKECREARLQEKQERQGQRQENHGERVEDRQEGHTDRVDSRTDRVEVRQEEKTDRTDLRQDDEGDAARAKGGKGKPSAPAPTDSSMTYYILGGSALAAAGLYYFMRR